MRMRPNRPFVAVAAVMALVMPGLCARLLVAAIVDEPRLIVMSLGLTLALLPFWLEFLRQLACTVGSRLELDDAGATWTRGAARKRVEWDAVVALSHGAMDPSVWRFTDSHGGSLALMPGWYGDHDALTGAMRAAIEGFARRLPVPERVVLRPSRMDRSIVLTAIGVYVAFVPPLALGLATIPREFVPPSTLAVGALAVVAATFFVLEAVYGAFRNQTEIDGRRIVRRRGFRTRSLPLAEVREARHAVRLREGLLPWWRTTLVTEGRPLELSARDEGYFEATRLLDTLVPSTIETQVVSRAATR